MYFLKKYRQYQGSRQMNPASREYLDALSQKTNREILNELQAGVKPIDNHILVFTMAFNWLAGGEFEISELREYLYSEDLSFGQGELKFHRTLDCFYFYHVYEAIRMYSETNGDKRDAPANEVYSTYHQILNPDAWKLFYSETLLNDPLTARFWRLPDLRDLTNALNPLRNPQPKSAAVTGGYTHFTKIPRWAKKVVETYRCQKTLSQETTIDLAIATLQKTILRLRKEHSSVQPYSETQARFWLDFYEDHVSEQFNGVPHHLYETFGTALAQGRWDVFGWEAYYTPGRWYSLEGRVTKLEPDLDGTRKSAFYWCGMPDGGTGYMAYRLGWEAELGSAEEIEFQAAVAVKEVEGVSWDDLDVLTRSHALAVLIRDAMEPDKVGNLDMVKRRVIEGQRTDEVKFDTWIKDISEAVKLYRERGISWSSETSAPTDLMQRILTENGHLFIDWTVPFNNDKSTT